MSRRNVGFSRRNFLKTSSFALGAAAVPKWFIESSHAAETGDPKSANDRPGVALIGCGGQGRAIAQMAARYGRIVVVCDVDRSRLRLASSQLGSAPQESDFRKVLERRDVDVVFNGTPDHWHTLINIAAMKAGKDVYCEKPLTLTIDEGKRLVAVARETKRILQTGSQQRSDIKFLLASELVVNGRLGKLKRIVVGLPRGSRDGPFESMPAPARLDWDFWQGQAPAVPYVTQRCYGTFRYWWEYSGGTMTDWGAHHCDIAQWANGTERSGPVEVEGKALVEMIPGGYTAASQFQVEYKYANGVQLSVSSETEFNGVRFEGENGWIYVTRGDLQASKPELIEEPLPSNAIKLYRAKDGGGSEQRLGNHVENFFDCVRSRQPTICEPEIGHRSVSVCHLGVISMRLGRKLKWDPAQENFGNDKEANKWLAREQRKPWSYDTI